MPAPEGAQLSEDGNYWWDASSNEWKSVADTPAAAAGSASAAAGSSSAPAETQQEGQLSPDGNYRWDGTQWQPVEGGAAAGAAGAAGTAEGAAAAGETVQIPSDLLDQLVNFNDHFPETAALCQYDGNMEGYATSVLALSEVPSEHGTDEALA